VPASTPRYDAAAVPVPVPGIGSGAGLVLGGPTGVSTSGSELPVILQYVECRTTRSKRPRPTTTVRPLSTSVTVNVAESGLAGAGDDAR
jgi:hypothetical protein